MPKQLSQFKGDMSNVFKGRNLRHLKIHSQYRGCTAEDLLMLMTANESDFCLEYFRSNCNASQAVFIAYYGGDHTKFKSEKHRQQVCSVRGMTVLRTPIVSSCLYKQKHKMMENHKLKMTRTFNNYRAKTEEIRDKALDAEDFGAALRAHQQIGIIDGHVGEDSHDPGRQSDAQIINIIAGGDVKLGETLAKKLGVKMDDAIEGEIVEG